MPSRSSNCETLRLTVDLGTPSARAAAAKPFRLTSWAKMGSSLRSIIGIVPLIEHRGPFSLAKRKIVAVIPSIAPDRSADPTADGDMTNERKQSSPTLQPRPALDRPPVSATADAALARGVPGHQQRDG